MNDTQAAGTALEASGPETDNKIAVRSDWSPEAFAQEVEREKAMRSILHRYMSEAMVKDHHYYSFKEGDKPAITQEGAHAVCSLMKCTIGMPETTETYEGPEGNQHLTVRARVQIYNQQGVQVATGDGICSTRESKYAYRWVWDNEVPNGVDTSQLKSKSGTGKNNRTWTQYQMPNQDLPDLYNTVLKMAIKRAKVAGVRQLPLVSELFVAEPEEDAPAPKAKSSTASGRGDKSVSAPKEDVVGNVVNLSKKLTDRGCELEDLVTTFLPEGVAKFEDLTPDQAIEVQPAMVELLNAKIKEQ